MKNIIFIIALSSFVFSEINLSGDARVRPRLDVKNESANKSSMDLYYLYRARLNVNANIGGGWFFNAKIGTNSVAGMTKMANEYKDDLAYDKEKTIEKSEYWIEGDQPGKFNSIRPKLSFLNLYYGFKKDNSGFWGGAFPLDYNPLLDIHFYPELLVDIPWVLLNNSSTVGFAGYIYKLNWFISVDQNQKEISKENDKETKRVDSYSFGFDYSMAWNEMIENINPRAIFSVSNSINPWPVTFGFDVNFKSLFGIAPTMSYHYSTQFINKDYLYDITHLRIKLNREICSGKLTFWTDIVSRIDKKDGMEEQKSDFLYIWADYKCKVFEGDNGSVSIKPTVRYQIGSLDKIEDDLIYNPDYNRVKLELTTEIKFK